MKTSRPNLLPAALVAAAALAVSSAAAQVGPWTDGELLVRTEAAGSLTPTIYRVVPETGATAVLTTAQYWAGWSGAMVFDSFRGGLLSNMSLPPDSPFTGRLWLVAHDGTAAAMPGFTGNLRALASTGDGRVFFSRHDQTPGPKTIEYFDANNLIQTLKDTDGVTPFQIEVEHLLYHASSNALIGSSSGWWSATDCAPAGASLYRIPLSADGLRVSGPVICASTSSLGANEEIMGLDHLPSEAVLVTLANGGAPYLRCLEPFSLQITTWAEPTQGNINGGVWSARIGRAVIHAQWYVAGLLTYGLTTFAGQDTGIGDQILTSLPLGGGGGFSPAEILFEVDVNGPGCTGFQLPYGAGLAGKNNSVPLLGVIGCPDIGSLFTISINSVVGGAGGVLFVGLAPAAAPFKGGTFLVGSIATQIPVVVGGTPGASGVGSLALPALLSDPILAGIDLYMQAGFADAAAVKGVSLSNGLRVQGN